MTRTILLFLVLTACVAAISLDIPTHRQLAKNIAKAVENQKQTPDDQACLDAFNAAYGTSCGKNVTTFVDELGTTSFTAFCTDPCYTQLVAGLEAADDLTMTDCSLSFVDACTSASDCESDEICSSGYCRGMCGDDCDGYCENGYCFETDATLPQRIASFKMFCAQDSSNRYCGDYIEDVLAPALNTTTNAASVCAVVEAQAAASCCFSSVVQCGTFFSNSSTMCDLAATCPFGPWEDSSAVCSSVSSTCSTASTSFCPGHDGYMCAKEIHTQGTSLLDMTCTASEWRSQYEESFDFLNNALASDTVGTFCSNDCHSHFITALDNTLTFESSNGLNCGEVWVTFDPDSDSDSTATPTATPTPDDTDTDTDDTDTDATDTETDTDDSSSSKFLDDFEPSKKSVSKAQIYASNVTADGSYASLTTARNFFNGGCVSRGSDNCLLEYLSLIDGLAMGEPTCSQMDAEGCCTGVFANCLAPALAITNGCTLAEACTSSENIDVGSSSCLGGTDACAIVCNPPATPTPAPRSEYKVTIDLEFAGMSCADVDSDAKRFVVVQAVKRVIAARLTGVEEADIEVNFVGCSKQTNLNANVEVFVADEAAASTSASTLAATDTTTLTSDLNAAVSDISTANGVTGISTATGLTASNPTVTEVSTTSGAAAATIGSLIFLFAAFLFAL